MENISQSKIPGENEAGARELEFPTSFSQERLWFLDQLAPGNPAYNFYRIYRIHGPLNVDHLQKSLLAIVERHEPLRTTFATRDALPVQRISKSSILPFERIDLRGLPTASQNEIVAEMVEKESQYRFDLTAGPLIHAKLLDVGDEEFIFIFNQHHINTDGWSLMIFLNELAQLYEGYESGSPVRLPDLPIQYADYAVWQRERLQGVFLEQQLRYWSEKLADASVLDIPTDFVRPGLQTNHGARHEITLSREMSLAVRSIGKDAKATTFMVLLTVCKILLGRLSGQTDILVGAPIAGRNRMEIEKIIGFFLNSLVFRTDLSGSPSFQSLLNRVRSTTLEAFSHQDLPFEKLIEELRPERDLSRTPFFQIFFNMMTLTEGGVKIKGLEIDPYFREGARSLFDITIYAQERPTGIQLQWVYNPDIFTPERVEEMGRQYLSHQADPREPGSLDIRIQSGYGEICREIAGSNHSAAKGMAGSDPRQSWTVG